MHVRIGRYQNDDGDDSFERDIDIVIHKYDTWNMDHTLALIILPMLKQLKETKHGSPSVDMTDVPQHLRVNDINGKEYWSDGHTDEKFHERWNYVLDEMIWAFEQIVDENSEEQFYCHPPYDPNDSLEETVRKIDVDLEGLNDYHNRIDNGTRLFGKYYRSLWD